MTDKATAYITEDRGGTTSYICVLIIWSTIKHNIFLGSQFRPLHPYKTIILRSRIQTTTTPAKTAPTPRAHPVALASTPAFLVPLAVTVAVTVTFLILTDSVALVALATAIEAAKVKAESKDSGAAVAVISADGVVVTGVLVAAHVAAVGRLLIL